MGFRAWAPGRVNLIGEHTDYTGGLVLPMAIHLGTAIEGEHLDGRIRLRSDSQPNALDIALPVGDPADVTPSWGRYVAGVAAEMHATRGIDGTVTSDLPTGAGLSSSAALEVATALALGADPNAPRKLALLAQTAEYRATGVPCGVMDQLASAAGVDGHALRIDCRTLDVAPVAVPDEARIVVIHSGQERTLAGSKYAERRAQCEAAEATIGPLRDATLDDLDAIDDDTVRHRARHVITENRRVDDAVVALAAGDLEAVGEILVAGHASLRDDFEVSTPLIDELVERLVHTEGVRGARLVGGGFGGCVIALCRPGVDPTPDGLRSWAVRPSAGARVD